MARGGTGRPYQLTRRAVCRFAIQYAEAHGLDQDCIRRAANSSLHAWSRASAILGYAVPVWSPTKPIRSRSPLLVTFAEHQRRHRGVREISIAKQCDHAAAFLQFLRGRARRVARIRLLDIDAFVIDRGRRVLGGGRRGYVLESAGVHTRKSVLVAGIDVTPDRR